MIKIKIEAQNASNLRIQLLALLGITEFTGQVESLLPANPFPETPATPATNAPEVIEKELPATTATKRRRTKAEIEADKLAAEQSNASGEEGKSNEEDSPEGEPEEKGTEEQPEKSETKSPKLDDTPFREAVIAFCGEDEDGSRLAHCKKVRVDKYGAQEITDIPMDKRQSYLDEIAKLDI